MRVRSSMTLSPSLSSRFNPVARTILQKMLQTIAAQEYQHGPLRPSQRMLQLLAEGSDGDIRTAINSLQFASIVVHADRKELWESSANVGTTTKGTRKKKAAAVKDVSPPSSTNSEQAPFLSCKDSRLDLFHALGKVLYAKRSATVSVDGSAATTTTRPSATTTTPSNENWLPAHLRHLSKPALQSPVDATLSSLPIDESLYLLYLQNNYLSFQRDVDDALLMTTEWISVADTLPQGYAGLVAASGVAFTSMPQPQPQLQKAPIGGIGRPAPKVLGGSLLQFTKPAFFPSLRKRKDLLQQGWEYVARMQDQYVATSRQQGLSCKYFDSQRNSGRWSSY